MSEKEMSRKDIGMLGFEIVAYSGDARSSLLEALKDARNGKFDGLEEKIQATQENLNLAHAKQTEMLALDAQGKDLDIGIIMIHAQDHLMTTILLKDIIYDLINIYKK